MAEPAIQEVKTEAKGGARPEIAARLTRFLPIGIVAGGLVLGGLGGSLLIAPKIIAARAGKGASVHAKGPARSTTSASSAKAGKSETPGEPGAHGPVFKLDNVIVNPAGTSGSRFLMASVAFELPDAKSEAAMRENDVRVRDKVISVLESQTMEDLTRIGARDSLKHSLAQAVLPLAGGAPSIEVYLTQFVIQ